MKITYTVHTVADTMFPVKAEIDDGAGGRMEIDTTIPGFTYEFVAADGGMVHTFHARATKDQPTAEFAVGDTVVMTSSIEAKAEPKPAPEPEAEDEAKA